MIVKPPYSAPLSEPDREAARRPAERPIPVSEAERPALNRELYRSLYLIRRAETAIRDYYHEDEMKTPMHMSMGEEAIAVGVSRAIGPTGQALGSYRSHALYLARTGDTDHFFAEMYGKTTGMARGKAGSMHMSAPASGLLCCAAVVASTIPVAVGAAFANKVQRNGKVVAAFFGDGAMDAGVFWESLNAASVMRLPILFVCEDNGLAVHTGRADRQGFRDPEAVVCRFECSVFSTESTDAERIYAEANAAVISIRDTGRPSFLRLRWYRYLEHVGINEDFDAGYRSRDEYLKWLEIDPIALQRRKLLAEGWASEAEVTKIESAVDTQVTHSVAAAKAAPFPSKEELFAGLFA